MHYTVYKVEGANKKAEIPSIFVKHIYKCKKILQWC